MSSSASADASEFEYASDMSRFTLSSVIENDTSSLNEILGKCGGIIKHKKVFGSFQLPQLIRNSPYALIATSKTQQYSKDSNKSISSPSSSSMSSKEIPRGFLFLSDQPASGDFEKFMTFLNATTKFNENGEVDLKTKKQFTIYNTLILKLGSIEEEYEDELMMELFRKLYFDLNTCENVILQLGKTVKSEDVPSWILSYFVEIDHPAPNTIEGNEGNIYGNFYNHKIFILRREEVVGRLGVRPALVEDYDDLIPIFDNQSEILTSLYGQFFIADIIDAQDEENKCLVMTCPATQRAIGFISLSISTNNKKKQTSDQLIQKCYAYESIYDDLLSNYIVVTLFCIDESYAMQAPDILPYIYQTFPEKSYILMTLPSECQPFPLLSDFQTLAIKPNQNYMSHIAYILGKDSLFSISNMEIQRYTSSMYSEVTKALGLPDVSVSEEKTSSESNLVSKSLSRQLQNCHIHEERSLRENPNTIAFTICMAGQILGLIVLNTYNSHNVKQKIQENGGGNDDISLGDNFDLLMLNYRLEDYFPTMGIEGGISVDDISVISHIPFSSILLPFTGLIMKEVSRQTGKRALLYINEDKDLPLPIKNFMHAVYPRRPMVNLPETTTSLLPYTCYAAKRPELISSNTRLITITSRIVLIGKSNAALSIIESLLFHPKYYFTNITLIDPNGLDGPRTGTSSYISLSDVDEYSQDFVEKLDLSNRVTIVKDTVIDIDRERQLLYLSGHKFQLIGYDKVIIATGRQEECSHRVLQCWEEKTGKWFLPSGVYSPSRDYLGVNVGPSNNVTLSTALKYIRGDLKEIEDDQGEVGKEEGKEISESKEKEDTYAPATKGYKFSKHFDQPILVYGNSSSAFATIHSLVHVEKIDPNKIIHILPTTSSTNPAFPNTEKTAALALTNFEHIPSLSGFSSFKTSEEDHKLVELVLSQEEENGITIWEGKQLVEVQGHDHLATFSNLTIDANNSIRDGSASMEDSIALSSFEGESSSFTKEEITQGFSLLILCDKHNVDPSIFSATSNNGLVYDGGIVVDSSFRTSDSKIFACGSVAKWTSNYKEGISQAVYSSKEIGEYVASSLITLSVGDENIDATTNKLSEEILGTKPRGKSLSFLGGINYSTLALPSLITTINDQKLKTSITGDLTLDSLFRAQHEQEEGETNEGMTTSPSVYSKVVSSSLGRIISIDCAGTNFFSNEKLNAQASFVGLHDSFLANCVEKYNRDEISDWSLYLKEDWLSAYKHDAFLRTLKAMKTILLKEDHSTKRIVKSMEDMLLLEQKEDEVITSRRKKIIACFDGNPEDIKEKEVTAKTINASLCQFLSMYHSSALPMYNLTQLKEDFAAAVAPTKGRSGKV